MQKCVYAIVTSLLWMLNSNNANNVQMWLEWSPSQTVYRCIDECLSKQRLVRIILWAVTLLCLIHYILHWLFKSVHPLWLCEWALRHRAVNTNHTFLKNSEYHFVCILLTYWHLSDHVYQIRSKTITHMSSAECFCCVKNEYFRYSIVYY